MRAYHSIFPAFLTILLLGQEHGANADPIELGYRYYAASPFQASKIDPAFADLSGGHYSSFTLAWRISSDFEGNLSTVAGYSTNNNEQFSMQSSVLGIAWAPHWPVFPRLGVGVGGVIATLSNGNTALGTVQTGTVFHQSNAIWMPEIGIGWRVSKSVSLGLSATYAGYLGTNGFNNLSNMGLGGFLRVAW